MSFAGKDPDMPPEDPDLIEMGWGKAPVKVKEGGGEKTGDGNKTGASEAC